MNLVERFRKALAFEPVDRLPMIEWAWYWDKTLDRWYNEGLPRELRDDHDIREYLGLDNYRQLWISPLASTCPQPADLEAGMIKNIDDYRRLKEHLYPQELFDKDALLAWSSMHKSGNLAIWFWLEGFFWFPRRLLGIERHLYTFYDDPELMHLINSDLLQYNLRMVKEISRYCTPSFLLFGEDLSYNHGPMLSKSCFDEFLAPYYRKIIPALKEIGIVPFIDSDGDVATCIPWFKEVGIEGIGPLERMAGVDVAQIRREHPDFKLIGGFDKTVMHLGEDAIRREFDRLLPVMQQGGYLLSVDHQTPPEVSLDQYRVYVSLLNEYGSRAVKHTVCGNSACNYKK